jgi:dUTP pyrophosphatase
MPRIHLPVRYLPNYDLKAWGPLGYAYDTDAGFDLRFAPVDGNELRMRPWDAKTVALGVAFDIPEGFELQIRGRSGMAFKRGVMLPHAPGTIDAGFQGELKTILLAVKNAVVIQPGERVCQAVLAPVSRAAFYDVGDHPFASESARGEAGFGSSGQS